MAASSGNSEASEVRRRGRQRLIGAIVLVLLLVVFVPMLLDSEPKPSRESPNLAIPPKDNAPPLPAPGATPAPVVVPAPAVTPSPDNGARGQAASGAQSPPVAKVEPKPEVAKVEPAKVEPVVTPAQAGAPSPAVAKVEPKPASEAPKAAEAARKGFVVQVGAFRDEAKLQQAQAKLKAAGVTHYTEKMDAKAGTLTRLRAGPFATREQAESAQVAIKRAALDGKVIPLP